MNKKVISTIILVLFIGACFVPSSSGTPRDVSSVQDGETIRLNNRSQMYDERLGSIEDVDWWSMFHHDPQLTGFSTSYAPVTNHVLWTHSIGLYLGGFCSPAVVDDRLYMGSSAFVYLYKDAMVPLEYVRGEKHPSKNNGHLFLNDLYGRGESLRQDFGILYCLNTVNGADLWYFYTGGYDISSPAVYDGRVYISSVYEYDYIGKIYCLDAATGDEIWNSSLYSPFSSPNVVDDKLYVSAIEIDGEDFIGKIFCLNALDGSEIWNYTIGIGEYLFLSTPAVAYGNIYFITENETEVPGYIYCLDADTGEKNWQSSIWSMLNSPVVNYGNVYVSSYDMINDRGILLCLDAYNGDEQWRYMMGIEELAGYSTPAVAYGNVYFSTMDIVTFRAKVTCINASTGGYVWARTPGDMMMLSSPAVADQKVYIASTLFGNLYCFDATNGAIIWSYPLGFETYTSPAIANFTLFTADASGTIYAFQDVNKRPNPPTITGQTNGNAGTPYTYTFTSTDPNGDQVSYYVDWGDNTNTGWFGPFASGTPQTKSHTWSTQGTYTIKAKAKDIYGAESDWGTLTVTMPRNRAIISPLLLRFLDSFPLLERWFSLIK